MRSTHSRMTIGCLARNDNASDAAKSILGKSGELEDSEGKTVSEKAQEKGRHVLDSDIDDQIEMTVHLGLKVSKL